MKFRGQEILDLLIEGVYLIAIFLIPLTFSYWFTTYNIFELNKLVVFKILIWALLLFTLIKIIFYFPYPPFDKWKYKNFIMNWRKYWLIPLIFIIGLSFSLFFSLDISKSFFGSYERQAGLLSYLFYFLWFILLCFNIISINNGRKSDSLKKRINRIIITTVFSSFLVSIYGILQILNIDFLTWPEPPYLTHRTLSTFGQPNFLASFLLLVIPLSAYLIYESRRFGWRFFYFLVFAAQLICLFLTSSRGALVAIVLMLFSFLIYLWTRISLNRFRKILIGIMVLLLLGVGVFSLEKFMPGRLSSFSNYQVGSLAARINFYQAAADSIAQRPIFGYGLENGGEIFIKYYEADWGIHGDADASTDRAHNLILDILLSSGFWGLLFFTIFYYAFFRLALNNINNNKNRNLSLALILGAGAYIISLLFSFSMVAGEVYFWLFFALLVVLNFPSVKFKYKKLNCRCHSLRMLIALILVFLAVIKIYGNLKILMADHYFNKIYYTLAQGDYSTVFILDDYIRQGKMNKPQQNFYDRFLGDKLSDLYPSISELTIRTVAQKKLENILYTLPEHGYENILIKAKISSALGNFEVAEDYFAILNAHSLHWPRGYFELARMLSRKGDFIPAIASYHLVELNLPDLEDERLNDRHRQVVLYYRHIVYKDLGELYERNQDYLNAGKYYRLAYRHNTQDFSLLKKIADSYYLRGDIETAIRYNKQGFIRSPKDYNWPLALAILNREKQNNTEALLFINKAIELAPNLEQLKELKVEYEQ